MATDTVPAAPGPATPNDPPAAGNTNPASGSARPAGGWLANALAPVDPARPTFSLNPTTDDTAPADGPAGQLDGLVDRSAPGVSSASFRGAADSASSGGDPAGKNHKRSIWKEMWLAAATRWAKGGGTANKRLDLAKARAQSQAHQVKESRTTTAMKSGGLPIRNTGGSGGGVKNNSGKSGGDSVRKGPVNSSGSGAGGSGRSGSGGSGGGRGSGGGTGGGAGGKGTGTDRRAPKDTGASGKGGTGPAGSSGGSASKDKPSTAPKKTDAHGPAPKGPGKQPGAGGGAGKPGPGGKNGKDGSSGTAGKAGTGPGAKSPAGKTDLTKDPKAPKGKGKDDAPGPAGHKTSNGKNSATKTPLQKSRETGHGDGTKARRVVDHVKAYMDGTRDGWTDEKHDNAKEHARLDKAHTDHKKTEPDHKTDKPATAPGPHIVTDKGDDGVSTDVKPLLVKDIDTNTLTLGTAGARGTVSRRELRNFKQYERKLEAKETVLHQIADACKTLEKQAEQEAKECQDLAEQAKSVKGGEKLGVTLAKLAEAAKNQAAEAAELARRAQRAAEMCKVVLTNIQTRYQPLYKAVVDSDETKPAELRFYNDKGSYAPAA
jgi:hypothetical protein